MIPSLDRQLLAQCRQVDHYLHLAVQAALIAEKVAATDRSVHGSTVHAAFTLLRSDLMALRRSIGTKVKHINEPH